MNQSILSQDFDYDICEAIDCHEKAIRTVDVNAGSYGVIRIFLCKDCIHKFKEVK